LAKNPGFKYTLLGAKAADDFVNRHFSENHSILHVYHALKDPGMKTDLLRYLVMLAEGGVYSDLDTQALKPVDDWIPQHLKGSVKAVIGVEFDQLDGDPWVWPGPGPGGEPSSTRHAVQFCQWTLAATPGHPLFSIMVDETVGAVRKLAAAKESTVSQLLPTVFEVMTTTGPAAWTDVVFRYLQKADASLTSLRQLSNMTQAKLIGDVLVLTIDGFGMGQEHSRSTNDGSIPETALIRHNFRHSWLPQYPTLGVQHEVCKRLPNAEYSRIPSTPAECYCYQNGELDLVSSPCKVALQPISRSNGNNEMIMSYHSARRNGSASLNKKL
jgi:alpha 1,6-mannosyltransferase